MPVPVIRRRQAGKGAPISDLPPLLSRIYRSRGVSSVQEQALALSLLPLPDLKDLPRAVEILADNLTGGKRLLFVGDYDADGATGCALGMLALQAMGFGREQVGFLVPDRFRDGYGLRPELVRRAALREPPPELLVTVDNGIGALAGVAAARELGMEVIITDHHLPGEELPSASAIVNPMQPGCPFPAKNLSGVGVLFYLLAALCSCLRERGWFTGERAEPRMADYLDLVALGTIADLVPLDHCNRILVHQGLRRIRAGSARPGILALLEAAGQDPKQATSVDLAFRVAPRINAAGRLDDITVGIACLCAEELAPAKDFVQTLNAINRERRSIGSEMLEDAEAKLAKIGKKMPMGLCLYGDAWHQGVAGILAARLRERWGRPALVCADAADGELRGSGRSVPGLNLRDVLAQIDMRCPGLLTRFGGHAMAAGCSLPAGRFEELAKAFDEEVRRLLRPEDLQTVVWSDGELAPEHFHIETARMLRDASPWGQGFPEPMFDGEFQVLAQRRVGGGHLRFRLQPEDGPELEAVWFNPDTDAWEEQEPQRLRAAYSLELSFWQGRERLQLLLRFVEPA